MGMGMYLPLYMSDHGDRTLFGIPLKSDILHLLVDSITQFSLLSEDAKIF